MGKGKHDISSLCLRDSKQTYVKAIKGMGDDSNIFDQLLQSISNIINYFYTMEYSFKEMYLNNTKITNKIKSKITSGKISISHKDDGMPFLKTKESDCVKLLLENLHILGYLNNLAKEIPKSFLIYCVSTLDAYLLDIFKYSLKNNPGMVISFLKDSMIGLNNFDYIKEYFPLEDILLKEKTTDNIKTKIINKCVDKYSFKNRNDKCKKLEKGINIEYKHKKNIIDICDLRDRFVHKKINDHDSTKINRKYCHYIILEIFSYLLFVTKAQLSKKDNINLNSLLVSLNNFIHEKIICYNKNVLAYDMICRLEELFPKEIEVYNKNPKLKHILLVNKLCALKFCKKDELVSEKREIESELKNNLDKFEKSCLMCYYSLTRKYDKTNKLMIELVNNKELDKEEIEDWIALKPFRKTKIFRETYKRLFDYDYSDIYEIQKIDDKFHNFDYTHKKYR